MEKRKIDSWTWYVVTAAFLLLLVSWKYVKELLSGEGMKKWIVDVLITSVPYALVVGTLIATIRGILFFYHRKSAVQDTRYLRILPSVNTEFDPEVITLLVRRFAGMPRKRLDWIKKGDPWFRVRFAVEQESNQIGIFLAYPQDKYNGIWDTLRNIYPDAEIHKITSEQFPQVREQGEQGYFQFGSKKLLLQSVETKECSPLTSILSCLRSDSLLDLHFRPERHSKMRNRIRKYLGNLKEADTLDTVERSQKKSLLHRHTRVENCFRVRLSLWSGNPQAEAVNRSIANTMVVEMNLDGSIKYKKMRFFHTLNDRHIVPLPFPRRSMVWDIDEVANIFHLPSGELIYTEDIFNKKRCYVTALLENQRSLANWELKDGVLLGMLQHPLYQREVRVSFEQLTKHFLLTGSIGMGKSSCVVEMLTDHLDKWIDQHDTYPGFTFIDPARQTIAVLQNRLALWEKQGRAIPKEKIKYFNLSQDADALLALNLLHKTKGYNTTEVAGFAADVILHTTGQAQNLTRTKRLLRMAIQALLEDEEEHNVFGIEDMFKKADFRSRVVEKIKDINAKRSWGSIKEDLDSEVEPILSRLDPILSDPTMRRVFCQVGMSLEIRKYMDQGYIVLIDILGLKNEAIKILVGYIITQYHLEGQKRPPGAREHLFLIEEAHRVQIPILANIIAEDRKFGLCLGLITQELEQFTDSRLVHAITSMIGMILSCAQGSGAMNIEKMTQGFFSRHFISQLSERTVAVYTRSKHEMRSVVTTCLIGNHISYSYLPDGSIAEYRTREQQEAENWGIRWGTEMMRNALEVTPIREIDEMIRKYVEGGQEEGGKKSKGSKNSATPPLPKVDNIQNFASPDETEEAEDIYDIAASILDRS